MIANVVQGGGGKWRTMVDDGLYGGKMAVGALYRTELAQGLSGLGYRIGKTRADGRFEIVGVPRKVIEAFSTRRAEIGAAMKARDLGAPGDDPRLADRAALLTRARKRGVDKDALRDVRARQATEPGFPVEAVAQLKRAGMRTVIMDEIMRQRDADLKEAVRASLAGEVKTAFEKLDDRVSEVPKSELGIEVASRWLKGSPAERQTTGVIAPTRALRDEINETIRDRLIGEGAVHGPARRGEKLVSRGLTNAEMSRASNYAAGDTVIFNRRYKTLAVEKGDEREAAKVDHGAHTVHLKDGRGNIVEWQPWRHAGAKGGVEVTGARRWNFAPATASGGHATIPAPGWSTGRWRKWNPSLGTACGSTSKTEAQWNSRTMMRNCRYPGPAGHGAEGTAGTESAARAEGLRPG